MYESGRDTASTTGSNYEILPAAASVSFEDTILIKMQNFWCVYTTRLGPKYSELFPKPKLKDVLSFRAPLRLRSSLCFLTPKASQSYKLCCCPSG